MAEHYDDCHHGPLTRRDFLQKSTLGLGALSLASLLNPTSLIANAIGIGAGGAHIAPRAKRIIYLYMVGAPSQVDLFDYKPLLHKMHGQELPAGLISDRLPSTSATQAQRPLVRSLAGFKQHGQSGMWMSDLLPYMSQAADEFCMIRSMHTESVQHEPGQLFTLTGSEIPGRPTFGAWISYGLGSMNDNLPTFIVLMTKGNEGGAARLYTSGFLPSDYEGVRFNSGKNPVLYLSNPPGVSPSVRREQLDVLQGAGQENFDQWNDPGVVARMAQYEMAFRMQTSIPEVMQVEDEPESIYQMYGEDSKKPGTYAANCLLARRLAERDVRFIQLYHGGWDHHGDLPTGLVKRCKEVDQPTAALIMDLKQRGLLEDTLIVWGGEFGRTSFSQGQLTPSNYGRDHHANAFTVLLAGGGVRPGLTYGTTDDFGYHITENPVHVHDLNATLLHILGLDHEKLTYKYQGRRFRLTDVHGQVVKDILA